MAQVVMIPLDRVVPDHGQPRQNFPQSHINAIAESMKNRGQRTPIHVRLVNGNGEYPLIDGECRHRAAISLGWKEIKAIVFDTRKDTDGEIFMDQILDNLVRKDMDIIETCQAYDKALNEYDTPVTVLAKAFGVTVSTIEKDLPLINLPMSLQRDVDQKKVSKEMARKLADLKNDGFSDALIKSAWKYAKRAPSVEGQSKRLEVWKTDQADEKSILEETKEDTTKKERRKFGRSLGKFMTAVSAFSKNAKDEKFMQGALMHLTKEVNDGDVKRDLENCYAVLDKIKAGLTEFTAHKP